MSGKFAKETEVSVEKTKAEIEKTVSKYGATSFGSLWQANSAVIMFEMRDRRLRFVLPLAGKDEFRFTPAKRLDRTPAQQYEAWEQSCRQLWRALFLVIKAKLEAVECGISAFDEEFLSHVVTASGATIGELLVPRIGEIAKTGILPPIFPSLPGPGQSTIN